jgi:hypothetical protein
MPNNDSVLRNRSIRPSRNSNIRTFSNERWHLLQDELLEYDPINNTPHHTPHSGKKGRFVIYCVMTHWKTAKTTYLCPASLGRLSFTMTLAAPQFEHPVLFRIVIWMLNQCKSHRQNVASATKRRHQLCEINVHSQLTW